VRCRCLSLIVRGCIRSAQLKLWSNCRLQGMYRGMKEKSQLRRHKSVYWKKAFKEGLNQKYVDFRSKMLNHQGRIFSRAMQRNTSIASFPVVSRSLLPQTYSIPRPKLIARHAYGRCIERRNRVGNKASRGSRRSAEETWNPRWWWVVWLGMTRITPMNLLRNPYMQKVHTGILLRSAAMIGRLGSLLIYYLLEKSWRERERVSAVV
jgi:hypothetical protein